MPKKKRKLYSEADVDFARPETFVKEMMYQSMSASKRSFVQLLSDWKAYMDANPKSMLLQLAEITAYDALIERARNAKPLQLQPIAVAVCQWIDDYAKQ